MKKDDRGRADAALVTIWEAMSRGELTAEICVKDHLEVIAAREEQICAWAWLDRNRAVREARKSDQERSKNGTRSLTGIPVGIKDIFATRGIPTQMGSAAFAGLIPRQSAALVRKIQARGGIILGKTVTTECAFLEPSPTKNPWNTDHTPGGSSSGSAAAVAAGFVPVAIGSQTNGSTIRPAAFCGVVGFKPTQGRFSMEGAFTFSHTLDQPGFFTRDVADAAWFFNALSRPPRWLPPKTESSPPKSAQIALIRTPAWDKALDYTQRHFLASAARIEGEGLAVREVTLPEIFHHLFDVIRTIMAAEAAFNLESLRLTKGPMLSATLTDFLARGGDIFAIVYQQALALRKIYQEELKRLFEDYDAIITPATVGEAPRGFETTGDPSFCSLWSLTGLPAITIPAGFGPGGLPLGIQIVGPRNGDSSLLALASRLESIFPAVSRRVE